MRRSRPMPSATRTTSAPVASQTFAISLMNEMRVIRAAFAASLIISADATSQRTTGPSMPACSAATASPSSSRNAPTTIRSGWRKSATAVPSAVNSGFEAYPTWSRPRVVQPMAHPAAGTHRDRALHHDDAAPIDRRQLVDHRPDRGEIGVARVRRRRADRDVDEVGAVDRLADVTREAEPLGVPRDQLREAGLVDRHLAAPEGRDPLGQDVADDDRVPELGEAGTGDEADVAGTEDCDA